MAIQTRDQLITRLPGSQVVPFSRMNAKTAKGASTYYSHWLVTDGEPGVGDAAPAYSSAGSVLLTKANGGALPFSNPEAGLKSYLTALEATCSVKGRLILFDRVCHVGGLTTAVATTLTTGYTQAVVTRYGGGVGVELWGEVVTPWTGTNSVRFSVGYTNSSGVDGHTATYDFPAGAAPVAGQMFRFTRQAGDVGIRGLQATKMLQVSNLTGSGGTGGTAGSLSLVLLRRIAEIVLPVDAVGASRNLWDLGMPEIPADACLSFVQLCSGASTGTIDAVMRITQG
jgi:hypothetical protein